MNIFSSATNTSLNKYNAIINNVNFLENEVKQLSSTQIKEKIIKLKNAKNINLNDEKIITEVFALTREVAKRNIGLRHYDTQLLGGLVLNDNKIAEMKTGEGKTLVATLAASLNAITNKGVHLVTVNDYLAKRDKEWMQLVYQSLGLTVGLIQKEMNTQQRQINYGCDITYVTNSEIGFDFLRDGTSDSVENLVLRPFNYCIIDEVDSILIDEARTPLILSSSGTDSSEKYNIAKYIIEYLKLNIHYEKNVKTKNIFLTDKGFTIVQSLLGVNNLYDLDDPWISFITNALKAKNFYKRDQDYLILNNKIAIIDSFTGRVMPDRRWSEGLHQAIEVKENLPVGSDLKTIASITYQSFFSLYPKISGMTGTAKTNEEEFKNIYNLEVLQIPTKNPIKRKDLEDLVFVNKKVKFDAVINECLKMYKLQRPLLVGTNNVEESEFLSEILQELNIKHKVLNAKPENIKRESEIIAQAGRKNAITIATNMAGRGTDIILGGEVNSLIIQKIKSLLKIFVLNDPLNDQQKFLLNVKSYKILKLLKLEYKNNSNLNFNEFLDKLISSKNTQPKTKIEFLIKLLYSNLYPSFKHLCENELKSVKENGGLYVLGTDRNESRRIDNQLRGRAGRQGDQGTSCFFLSLEDNLFTTFGADQIKNIMKFLNFDKNEPITEKSITNSLDKIQEKIEKYYYTVRKDVFKYDEVLNFYRNFVFKERNKILRSNNLRTEILLFNKALINNNLSDRAWYKETIRQKILKAYKYKCQELFMVPIKLDSYYGDKNFNLKTFLYEQFLLIYDLKMIEIENRNKGLFNKIQKDLILEKIDFYWNDFLEKVNLLGEVIGWQNYAQKDPLIEYKKECSILFDKFLSNVRRSVIYEILDIQII